MVTAALHKIRTASPVPGALMLLFTLLFPVATHAAKAQYIQLSVATQEVFEGDAIVLEVAHTGLQDPLDISSLDLVGQIRRETAGTRIAVVGGRVVEIRLRRIEMVPRGRGVVVIGPLTAGPVQSNSISVRVLADRQVDWQPSEQDIKAVMRVSVPAPYVQQQFVLDIELQHRHQLVSEVFDLPDLAGMRVLERYAARRPAIGPNGQRSVTWRYLVRLDRSGEHRIAPFIARGTLVKSRRERSEFSVSTPAITLQVKPARSDSWWLPARHVELTEQWSTDKRSLQAGDETIRTIRVRATGVTAEQIPDLEMPPARGLKISRIDSSRDTEMTDRETIATATFRYRVLAMSPIPVFPDTIRLMWWDTGEDRQRTSILPAQRIQIGMPDREALLNAFGKQETLVARLTRQINSLGIRHWLLPASLVLLLLSVLFAVFNKSTGIKRRLSRRHAMTVSARATRACQRLARAGRWTDAVNAMHHYQSQLALTPNGHRFLKYAQAMAIDSPAMQARGTRDFPEPRGPLFTAPVQTGTQPPELPSL